MAGGKTNLDFMNNSFESNINLSSLDQIKVTARFDEAKVCYVLHPKN